MFFVFFLHLCLIWVYMWCMNDVVKSDIKAKIMQELLNGKDANTLISENKYDPNLVIGVSKSSEFVTQCGLQLERSLKVNAVTALHNIVDIMNDKKASQATRLKANTYIIDKALDFSAIGGAEASPSTMTQDQLAKRLQTLQKEANKRAKPIDTGVIDLDVLSE